MHRLPRSLKHIQTLRQHLLLRPNNLRQRNFSLVPRRKRPDTLYRAGGEPVRYQAVRFRRPPFFTWRRAVTTALYFGVGYAYMTLIFRYLDVEIEIVEGEEVKRDGQEGQAAEGEEDENEDDILYTLDDSTFIPMTWATKLPRAFYKGSDPEWQEFVKMAKDKARQKKIQNELVTIVYTGTMKHPIIHRQLGKDPKIGKYWLDITFPDAPPQEYERYGVEIGDDFIAWSKQKVSQENQWRLTRALWPKAAAESLYATTKVLGGIQWRRMKQALGWEGKDPTAPEERYKLALDLMEKRSEQAKGVGKTQTPDGTTSSALTTTTTTTSQTTSNPSSSSADLNPSNEKNAILPWLPMPSQAPGLNSVTSSTDLPIALHTFSHSLQKHWNPHNREPPRGTFVVQGLVEVRGARGRMIFDVQSCYDPKAGKFVNVQAAVRGFKKWNQAPRGGA
ncbi:hypothetical protein LTR62_003644 [Meristemomyces frigidus]|uniref:Uncharacterized protein n=1 Tax=Meristemomyces frigidus TaxID=1508187 RepID=A0AAN7TJM1_9PEZI|nr:hypothetical protein LTR62_003644 [Meristemomyces frigidus]